MATRANWYPEATDGLMDFVGVKEVEQPDGVDTLKTGDSKVARIKAKTTLKARIMIATQDDTS